MQRRRRVVFLRQRHVGSRVPDAARMCRVTADRSRRVVGLAAGALAFLAAHLVIHAEWARWFGAEHVPWFLNEGRANAVMVSSLFLASLAGGYAAVPGLMFAAGAFAAMTIVLFNLPGGPGTIFPIVMV